ncbi:MAG: hypothetical protein RLZZ76_466 [Candidatus Parcubacteria bacterium]|jgi:disulfide bond formation protein DsbB
MEQTIALLNFILALGGIGLGFAAFVVAFDLVSKNFSLKYIIEKWWMLGALALTFTGSVMTLVYSEVFDFVPCGLCWLQRVFLYPQVFLLAIALKHKDTNVARYGIALSIPGAIVSLYQHYLQMGGSEIVGCPTSGGDCSERILFEFGFMTFPLMSAFLFLFLIALYTYILKTRVS